MNVHRVATLIGYGSLLFLIVLPPCLFFAGAMTQDTVKLLMLIGTLLWFAAALTAQRKLPA